MSYQLKKSLPSPLGASPLAGGWNFAVYSESRVTLCVGTSPTEYEEFEMEVTGSIYHTFVEIDADPLYYGYKKEGVLLVDPYAKLLDTGKAFGDNRWKAAENELIAVTKQPDSFDWEGTAPLHLPKEKLIIYEMHVRAFTQDASSKVQHPGTYAGLIEKIPYLQSLGINAIELMPIHEFDETEYHRKNPKTHEKLYNFWGYSTLSFFAPMQRYAATDDVVSEFKKLVKECHKAGIAVILDVVYNHTGEGNEKGRTLSWKGFSDNYYIMNSADHYMNFSGCGNTFNCNYPIAQDMIIDSLRYWHTEYQIDGFRFDLMSILSRDTKGNPLFSAPIVERIAEDPLLKNCTLFAEPWDAAGLYQVGSFYKSNPKRWCEWNDDFRSVIRRFVRGDQNLAGRFATKLSGSEDLYGDGSPLNSLNFVTSHDGFTLQDLVSYNTKHNLANGEQNHDGMNNNDSWNSGQEGPTDKPKVISLRLAQMKNYLLALLLAQGSPMLLMGDEYGHTKLGNNNSWCQDNALNWFQWDQANEKSELLAFYKELIQLRKENPQLHHTAFLKKRDVDWHGLTPHHPDWSEGSHLVAYTLKDHEEGHHHLYIAFNSGENKAEITLPHNPKGKKWQLAIKTDDAVEVKAHHLTLPAHSAVVLQARE